MINVWKPLFEKSSTEVKKARGLKKIKPFSALIVGSSELGKSHWFEWIYNTELSDCYDFILVFCETNVFTKQYDFLPKHKTIVYTTWSDEVIHKVKRTQEKRSEEGKELWDFLIIIDDVFDTKMKYSPESKKLWTLARNYRITPIRISQKYSWASTEARSGAKLMVSFSCVGLERDFMKKEFLNGALKRRDYPDHKDISRTELSELVLDDCWSEPYRALVRDKRIINGQYREDIISSSIAPLSFK